MRGPGRWVRRILGAMGTAGAALGLGLWGPEVSASGDGTSKEPRATDTDDDGLTDDDETNIHGTDPIKWDTDEDGLPDGWEVGYLVPTDPGVTDGLDPLDDGTVNPNHGPDGDPDGDGYLNYTEYYCGTDPTVYPSPECWNAYCGTRPEWRSDKV